MSADHQFPRRGANIAVAGSTAISGTVVLSKANGVSFGMLTTGGQTVITASAGVTTAIQSISAGTTRVTDSVFLASAPYNGIGITGQTITMGPPPMNFWHNSRGGRELGSFNGTNANLGVLFQRIEVPAPIIATRLEFLVGNASDTAVFNSCPIILNMTPGQYMVGMATNSNADRFSVAFYTMTGSSIFSVSSATASYAFGILFGASLAGSSNVQGAGGSPMSNYFGDGTYTVTGPPPASLQLSQIQRTILGSVNGGLISPLIAYNVPYFQIAGTF